VRDGGQDFTKNMRPAGVKTLQKQGGRPVEKKRNAEDRSAGTKKETERGKEGVDL